MTKLKTVLLAGAVMLTAFGGAYTGREIRHNERASLSVTVNCDTDEQCAATPACALKPGCDGSPATEPYHLVGIGCMGGLIAFPIYRDEEDEFPAPCMAIEAVG